MKKILIVDDSSAIREILRGILQELAVEIQEAKNLDESNKKLQETRFDLIISDLHMPLWEGLKILELVRNNETHKNTPFLMITGDINDEGLEKAKKLSIQGWLIKPFENENVVYAVKKYTGLS